MKEIKTYQEALDFLYANLPMFQRQGAPAMKKDLTNIRLLCDVLGNPQDSLKCIHIGGTNGKGSTGHMLSAMLQSQGKSVGVYTSPHYKDFRERIKINTKLVSKKWILNFLNQNMEHIMKIRPSFFEITVAMAFLYFAEQKTDVCIIEVGLGGRLDSTNIITPLISVITNISLDHTQFLGDTLPEIAGEKAGIIKKNIPVIIGETQDEVAQVFIDKAKLMNTDIVFADNVHKLYKVDYDESTNQVSFHIHNNHFDLKLNWFTDFQIANLQTALTTIQWYAQLEGMKIDLNSFSDYLVNLPSKTYFLGRWMTLVDEPKIIADSAHNKAGLDLMFRKLEQMKYAKIHFVLGFSNDKDLSEVLPRFPHDADYYFAKADIPRGLDAKNLKSQASKYQLKGRSYVSVKNAFAAAKRKANPEDLIYVGGSIFVVAEVL